ncbi:MAG TPA: hypothetical protein VEY91_03825 [Candidatus Limnocylindria bacterium]|nr:hypothetical protein [Candidatus Limnocylindria bacterium]
MTAAERRAGEPSGRGARAPIALLGPQRLQPTLRDALAGIGVVAGEAMVATVTAGWQEREPDDHELHDHLGGRSLNLQLYLRAERTFARDPELATAHHQRQERLRELQSLYAGRLRHAVAAWDGLARTPGDGPLLDAERDDALAAIRALDDRHVANLRAAHHEFDTRWRPLERDGVAREHAELRARFVDCAAVAIAGGHVAVLLNRLRLFGVAGLVGDRPVVAWSAGAMAISERVVSFHDSPPDGEGRTEMIESGLGLALGVVPLPHARRRLKLDDPPRVALMARRFAPALCLPLDEGSGVRWDGRGWLPAPHASKLSPAGDVVQEPAGPQPSGPVTVARG